MCWIVRAVQTPWHQVLCLDPFKRFAALYNVAVEIEGELLEENASGDGQYDAFLNAIRKMYKESDNSPTGGLCRTYPAWKSFRCLM